RSSAAAAPELAAMTFLPMSICSAWSCHSRASLKTDILLLPLDHQSGSCLTRQRLSRSPSIIRQGRSGSPAHSPIALRRTGGRWRRCKRLPQEQRGEGARGGEERDADGGGGGGAGAPADAAP